MASITFNKCFRIIKFRESFYSQNVTTHLLSRKYAASPNVTQPSFWMNMVPKPLRKDHANPTAKKIISREWNPATFFIVIFLLIGSNAIQMIALKKECSSFTRRTEAKISLLKEVIERIQNGEKVDVEGILGTGNVQREQEWEEAIQEVEGKTNPPNTQKFLPTDDKSVLQRSKIIKENETQSVTNSSDFKQVKAPPGFF